MAVSWEYVFQYMSNMIFGSSLFSQAYELFMLSISLTTGILVVGIIYKLYKNYKQTESVETLLFLLGMISLIPANVFLTLQGVCYSTFGLPGLGELLTIITLFPAQFTYLCVNLFAIRMTFPKRYKIVLAILLVISVILIGTESWAVIQGPPYSTVRNFTTVYSFEIQIVRFLSLGATAVIPIGVFYYFAAKIREENRPQSNLSVWLGTGILFFAIPVLIISITPEFGIIQVLYLL
ncbi:MAG: hypothetical protein ACFFDN_32255, partial [Candidatus Hodarchaeota archaeon]